MNLPTTPAAWLEFIKVHGEEAGGVSNFAAILGTYPIKVKQAIDPLVLAGYVTMVGKPGPGGYKYFLTSLGHRYLNENEDELAEEDQAEPPPTFKEAESEPPRKRPVVPLPHQTVMLPRQTPPPPPADEPEESPFTEQEQQTQARRSEDFWSPARVAQRSEAQQRRRDREREGAEQSSTADRSSFDLMDAALYELLYERFADQVSAKDLVERMTQREDGDDE
jgi:hypothetical protein